MHNHHIVPLHRDPTSTITVEVTPTQHAMFHWCEWQLHGHINDRRAWKILTNWDLSHGHEERKKWGKIIGAKNVESGHLSSISSKAGKASSKLRFRCLVTGHVSNAGGLMVWQRARGIDTSLKERIQ